MKKIFLLIVITVCFMIHSFAQSDEIVVVKAGEPLINVAYRFPDFIKGFVYHKSGDSSTARLNFNILSEEMHFIDGKGDTLAIFPPNTISSIVIDTITYYYSKDGYLELLSNYDSIQVAGKIRFKQQIEKIGAYGQASPTASIESYRSISDRNRMYSLSPNEEIKLTKDVSYYFIDKKRNALRATKPNLLKLFPGKRDRIEKYLEQHPVNFNSRVDIDKLLLHVTSL